MTTTEIVAIAVLVFAATAIGTGIVRQLLLRWAVLDHPNARSSHIAVTPRGGGLALVPVVILAWLGQAWVDAPDSWPVLVVCAAGLVVALVSWVDDVRGLSAGFRLAAQLIAVAAVMLAAPLPGLVFAGWLGATADVVAAAVIWLWFINVFNFMDGIDGLAGVEATTLGLGVALVSVLAGSAPVLLFHGVTLAAAALGFLIWNWPPARLFLGDVGSIGLGFLLGWLLLRLAAEGQAIAALILPLYYLADGTITLARRLLRGERPWQAHREHYYQKAIRAGARHTAVVRRVIVANAVLLGMAALAALGRGGLALACACLAVGMLLAVLAPPAWVPARLRAWAGDYSGKDA